ncbi:MAG: DUF5110 domain-containing protein [Fibrobacterales bacterium]
MRLLTKVTGMAIAILFSSATMTQAAELDPVFWQPKDHAMLPKWAYGYWQVGFAPVPADNAAEVLQLAQEHRNSEHPGDVWILDLGSWNCTPVGSDGWASEDWCAGKFDDPADFIKKMNDMNWHIGINYHPWGHQDAQPKQEYINTLIRDAQYGSEIPWIDIRSNDPIWWMWDATAEFWKNNGNKRNMMLNYLGSFSYGDLDQDHDWDLGKDAAFPSYWTGDTEPSWRNFNDQVKRITHDGAWDGLYTLHMDTPGHFFLDMKEYPELTARTVLFSDWSPLVQQHGQGGRLVKQATQEVQEIMIKSRKLRYRLMPYIYTLNWEMWAKALPITRPMDMMFPNDNSVKDDYQQYMFGNNFLVAPVISDRHDNDEKAKDFGSSTMEITLPQDKEWIDYWSHEEHAGGTTLDYDVTDWGKIPIFVAKGSIIPMGPTIKWIEPSEHPDPLTLDIFPAKSGEEATFTMYDDDGETLEYKSDKGATTTFTAATTDKTITFTIAAADGDYAGRPSDRGYIVKLNLQDVKAAEVYVNGEEISETSSVSDILDGKTENGWAFDANKKTAYVAFRASTDEKSTVVYSIEGGLPAEDLSSESTPSSDEESSSEKDAESSQASDEVSSSDDEIGEGSSAQDESSDEPSPKESSQDTSPLTWKSAKGITAGLIPVVHIQDAPLSIDVPQGTTMITVFSITGEVMLQSSVKEASRNTLPQSLPHGMLFIKY